MFGQTTKKNCVINVVVTKSGGQKRSIWLQQQTSATHSELPEWLQPSHCLLAPFNCENLNLIKGLATPMAPFPFIPKLHRSSWWWRLKCTQTLKRSVMVMLKQCQNLYHWDVCKRNLLASANAGHSLVFFSSSGFRVDLSYSLRDPLKDPQFSLPGPPENFNLSHNRPVSIFPNWWRHFSFLRKTENSQKY